MGIKPVQLVSTNTSSPNGIYINDNYVYLLYKLILSISIIPSPSSSLSTELSSSSFPHPLCKWIEKSP